MDLRGFPFNPVPEGAAPGAVNTADGTRLRYVLWPARGASRGTVTLLQGRAEFIEKYFEVVADLLGRGFGVAALDWRGQGGSDRLLRDPRRGHIGNFGQYVEDLDTFVREVVLRKMPGPHFALAHSTGAHVALRAALAAPTPFRRLVLAAPFLDFASAMVPRRITTRLGGLLGAAGLGRAYIPGGGPTPLALRPFERNVVTSDPERYRRTVELVTRAPDLAVGAPTIGWVRAATRSMRLLESAELGAISIPVLMIAPGADLSVSARATELAARRMKTATYLFIPGARHELLFERDAYRRQFWGAFDAFVPGSD